MRFSISSLIVVGAYMLNTVSANVEQVESIATSQHATAAELGSRELAGLLSKRATCDSGFGLCPNDAGVCCPLGGDCCGNGRCCGAGSWCYTASICCGNDANGCANQGCCPKGSNCCADGNCCPSGWYCYRSPSNGGAIRCCPNGQACA
ncbi:hypothetical protein AGABI1DRAFT_99591 [Agaricus bisporus var. burnettii JB137-S8]|uniref:Granulins domain-containing protein n=1 Tax=Agaricus bisporus var. burnettii (strain JB137-S8 / ATCC MYA-4627 / FGSC 10392) TaxID=597362 RepID=K5XA79_AGABU|nr:uncharacterized protein AGABI1DRAFT_99591 [Agaricus bisporus var. burnettii JB137-S8]EKM79972.1 hypothetical protein AGABI1DRAFT_99591 [Agaricus bisporus var. burnettii JB137-S8]